MPSRPPTTPAGLCHIRAPGGVFLVLITDGGGQAGAALTPVHGAELVAALLARPDRTVSPVWLNGAPAGRIELGGRLATVSVEVENGRVVRIHAVANPRKLTRLDEPSELTR